MKFIYLLTVTFFFNLQSFSQASSPTEMLNDEAFQDAHISIAPTPPNSPKPISEEGPEPLVNLDHILQNPKLLKFLQEKCRQTQEKRKTMPKKRRLSLISKRPKKEKLK